MARRGVFRLIDQQRWLDPIGDALQKTVERAYAAGGPTGQQVKNLLSGTWLGHPLHPLLTDVPIGAWTAALMLDSLDAVSDREVFAPGSDAAVAIGIMGALGAAATGLSDWHFTTERPRRLGLAHGLLNLGATTCYGMSSVARWRGARRWGRNLARLGYAMVACSAYLGGELVYREHLGVDHSSGEAPSDFVPVLDEQHLHAGTPQKVEVDGVPVLLVRQGGHIYALGEMCSHLGGPLSEGAISDGWVTCPWHHSQFALADGHVLNGPATFPQPCYQTRVRNGTIEVGPRCLQPGPEALTARGQQAATVEGEAMPSTRG